MAVAGRVAIVPKGEWSANATYKRLDAVTYNNTLYFAKKDVPAGTVTSNTEYWSKSIVGGAGGVATADEAGVVKPADGLTVAEDGTLKVSIDGTTLTMDQVNNVIKLADTLKDKINGAFPAANLINNLTTTEAGFGLDARQGKALDDKITEINGSLMQEITINDCDTAASIIELLNKSKRSIGKGTIGELQDSAIKNFLGTVPNFHNYVWVYAKLIHTNTAVLIAEDVYTRGVAMGFVRIIDIRYAWTGWTTIIQPTS